jgi:hypothetical protein
MVGAVAPDTVTTPLTVLSELAATVLDVSVIVLLVRMFVVAKPTRVSVASGKVRVRLAVCEEVRVVVVEVLPAALNPIRVVGSTESIMNVVLSTRVAAGLDHAAAVAEVATND